MVSSNNPWLYPPDGNGHANGNGNGHVNGNGHNGHGGATANGHANGNGHAQINGQVNGYGGPSADGNANSNGHSNGHPHSPQAAGKYAAAQAPPNRNPAPNNAGQSAAGIPTPRPYFLPASLPFESFPQELQLAILAVVQPCYVELVLGVESALERQAGATLTFMILVEVIEQYELGRLVNDVGSGGPRRKDYDKQLRRYLRVVKSKESVQRFLARLQHVRRKRSLSQFSLPSRAAPFRSAQFSLDPVTQPAGAGSSFSPAGGMAYGSSPVASGAFGAAGSGGLPDTGGPFEPAEAGQFPATQTSVPVSDSSDWGSYPPGTLVSLGSKYDPNAESDPRVKKALRAARQIAAGGGDDSPDDDDERWFE